MKNKRNLLSVLLAAVLLCACVAGMLVVGANAEEPTHLVLEVDGVGATGSGKYSTVSRALYGLKTETWAPGSTITVEISSASVTGEGVSRVGSSGAGLLVFSQNTYFLSNGKKVPITIRSTYTPEGEDEARSSVYLVNWGYSNFDYVFANDYTFENLDLYFSRSAQTGWNTDGTRKITTYADNLFAGSGNVVFKNVRFGRVNYLYTAADSSDKSTTLTLDGSTIDTKNTKFFGDIFAGAVANASASDRKDGVFYGWNQAKFDANKGSDGLLKTGFTFDDTDYFTSGSSVGSPSPQTWQQTYVAASYGASYSYTSGDFTINNKKIHSSISVTGDSVMTRIAGFRTFTGTAAVSPGKASLNASGNATVYGIFADSGNGPGYHSTNPTGIVNYPRSVNVEINVSENATIKGNNANGSTDNSSIGGIANATYTEDSRVIINITGGTIEQKVVAVGGRENGSYSVPLNTAGYFEINVSGSAVLKKGVYGVQSINDKNINTFTGTINMDISATVQDGVYGVSGASPKVGNINILISGGTVSKTVYGVYNASTKSTEGNVKIEVTGGTLNGEAKHKGYAGTSYWYNPMSSLVGLLNTNLTGNLDISLDVSQSGRAITLAKMLRATAISDNTSYRASVSGTSKVTVNGGSNNIVDGANTLIIINDVIDANAPGAETIETTFKNYVLTTNKRYYSNYGASAVHGTQFGKLINRLENVVAPQGFNALYSQLTASGVKEAVVFESVENYFTDCTIAGTVYGGFGYSSTSTGTLTVGSIKNVFSGTNDFTGATVYSGSANSSKTTTGSTATQIGGTIVGGTFLNTIDSGDFTIEGGTFQGDVNGGNITVKSATFYNPVVADNLVFAGGTVALATQYKPKESLHETIHVNDVTGATTVVRHSDYIFNHDHIMLTLPAEDADLITLSNNTRGYAWKNIEGNTCTIEGKLWSDDLVQLDLTERVVSKIYLNREAMDHANLHAGKKITFTAAAVGITSARELDLSKLPVKKYNNEEYYVVELPALGANQFNNNITIFCNVWNAIQFTINGVAQNGAEIYASQPAVANLFSALVSYGNSTLEDGEVVFDAEALQVYAAEKIVPNASRFSITRDEENHTINFTKVTLLMGDTIGIRLYADNVTDAMVYYAGDLLVAGTDYRVDAENGTIDIYVNAKNLETILDIVVKDGEGNVCLDMNESVAHLVFTLINSSEAAAAEKKLQATAMLVLRVSEYCAALAA